MFLIETVFYFTSMIKMVYNIVIRTKQYPKPRDMLIAIKRNFGGFDAIDPVEIFEQHLQYIESVEKVLIFIKLNMFF